MTHTPTLREALEEAREALAGCMSVWARHRSRRNQQEVEDDTTRAVIALLARIDAALSAPEPQGWRPIDTAPKDGTRIAVFNTGNLRTATCTWIEDRWVATCDPRWYGPDYFTHWMPLPEPPK